MGQLLFRSRRRDKKTRPAVILSNNASNSALNRVQIVPLTSHTGKVYPSEAIITLNDDKSKAMADQLTTATKERLLEKLGVVSPNDLLQIERVVKIQLGLKV